MEISQMQEIDSILRKIKSRFDDQPRPDGLICKQGRYDDCAVLKLQKPSWTNDGMDQLRNQSGIFFSVWMGEEDALRSRINYNIHALKLRHLSGYSITSRDFASDFRARFAAMHSAWPNVSVDYGPLTLMQGWIECNPTRFEQDVVKLMNRFEHLIPLIDRLLAARRK